MVDTSPPNDPDAFQEWIKQLEQKWQAGSISDPQAVAIILLNDRNEVLLQLRDNNPKISFASAWTLPGGVVESHETPQQAAQRELAEETGLRVELSLWKTYRRKPPNRQFIIDQYVFFGRTRQGVDQMILGEGQALRFFARKELESLSIAFEFDQLLYEFFGAGMGTAV